MRDTERRAEAVPQVLISEVGPREGRRGGAGLNRGARPLGSTLIGS
jgi:hypothetical protein